MMRADADAYKKIQMNHNIALPFFRKACSQPSATALVVDEQSVSYAQLTDLASAVAERHILAFSNGRHFRVGIFASYSLEAYTALLAACWAGCAYVAINPAWPDARLKVLFEQAELDLILTDRAGANHLNAQSFQGTLPPFLTLDLSSSKFIGGQRKEPAFMSAEQTAYVMFTSGSTGIPKGVVISTKSVASYVETLQSLFNVSDNDRVGQFSELSFDFSVMDLFMTWNGGGALYVVPAKKRLLPAEFIRKNLITIWASVPSVVHLMTASPRSSAGSLPTLRLIIFCGEALTVRVYQAIQALAPQAQIENHYGPTEATVSCSRYALRENVKTTLNRDTISIGKPLGSNLLAILDQDGSNFLQASGVGQLCIAGPQLSDGYFGNADQTTDKFRILEHPAYGRQRWYLSGDLAFFDDDGDFHHLGRIDNQVKIKGYRIDLEDIEAHLKKAVNSDQAIVVTRPNRRTGDLELVAAVCEHAVDDEAISAYLKAWLPSYMIPKDIERLPSLPKNTNGKLDRRAIAEIIRAEKKI